MFSLRDCGKCFLTSTVFVYRIIRYVRVDQSKSAGVIVYFGRVHMIMEELK